MSKQRRKHIPADIKRQVLVEAGHMCAIPACQHPAVEIAHIVPYSEVKEHTVDNLIALCPNHHRQYDVEGTIDCKSIRIYKQKLQFLNMRYTKYEMRVLALLAQKLAVAVNGEIHVMGLLEDGLIENKETFMTQSFNVTDKNGKVVYKDNSVQLFGAMLTEKGREFIRTWRSKSKDLMAAL